MARYEIIVCDYCHKQIQGGWHVVGHFDMCDTCHDLYAKDIIDQERKLQELIIQSKERLECL